MFPDANYVPAGLFEQPVGLRVALTVSADLLGPELRVPPRWPVVVWAAVPVAAVDEDGEAGACEDDIRGAPHGRNWARRDAVPQSQSVEVRAKSQLGSGVAVSVASHCRADID